MTETRRRAEVLRLLERYLVEVVERYDLCPWARGARLKGEVGFDVLWGTPDLATWVAAANAQLARGASVVMIVAPELGLDRIDMHGVRNDVSNAITSVGVAEFHPDAELDLVSPARLVPFTRRSPDPMLQLVPLSVLDSVRNASPPIDRAQQLQILGGKAPPPKRDAADRIASANHATVTSAAAELTATLADIAADRARSYAAVGIAFTVGST